LRVAVEFGWLDRDQTDIFIPRDNEQGRAAALETACEGLVMLKNEGGVLPLNKDQLRSVAVIGPDAYPAVPVAGGSARVEPFAAVSFLQGLSDRLGPVVPVYYHRGLPTLSELADRTPFSTVETGGSSGLNAEYFSNADLQGSPIVTRVESHVNIGRPREDFGGGAPNAFPDHTASERFTGYYKPQSPGDYEVFVQSTGEGGGFYRLYIDDKLIFDDWKSAKQFLSNVKIPMEARPYKIVLEHHGRGSWLGNRLKLGIVAAKGVVASEAKAMAAKADAVVVAVGFEPEIESEGGDRMFQLPPGQAELIREIAAANKNTIVVVTSGGGVDMTGWLDRVPALIEAWYPGQEGGAALADVLTGAVNPSGRLPITFDRRWEDNPSHDSYYPLDAASNRVVYSEGVFVGYRGYDASGKTPAFPFGYGLSYTSFSYSKLSIGGVGSDGNFTVSFDVTNTGNRQGSDVAQVYVGEPHPAVIRPEKELKGFEKVNLRPGETKRVSITLGQRALSYYDVTSKDWRVDPGEFDVMIGRSAGEIVLMGKLTVAKASARR
ncbi:MAG TPA: glycoside hydrolase family 3 C-terminal domain-containing protein, partial [Blastocatellia bacterium]|nr:glycoside hydrolase family 3 C-terminal domain-containing protein [Blastocatellia bacterium]